VASNSPASSYSSATRLKVGRDGTGAVYRSYVQAPAALLTAVTGHTVVSAQLQVYNSLSATCATTANTAVGDWKDAAPFTSSTTWNSRPARNPTTPVSSTVFNPAHGGPAGGCGGPAYASIDITALAQAWAGGTYTVPAVELAATDETGIAGYKEFYAREVGSGIPTFYVTLA
jgi:hypothetical protein